MICFPNYDKSILSVIASVLKHYGVSDCPHQTLPQADKVLAKGYRNVVLMVFDGLGVEALRTHLPENSFLRKHLICPISSVFPPTTVAATTTIHSGLSPLEHGWLGWDLYFKELDENVSVFPNTLQRNGEKAADYNVGWRYIPYQMVYSRIEQANPAVQASFVSPFSSKRAVTLQEIENTVLELCTQKTQNYICTYYESPDLLMHEYGVSAPQVKEEITRIDQMVESLCGKLRDSVVLVTADHGLIDSKVDFLDQYPDLWQMLERPASMEPRALSLFVKEAYRDVFPETFESTFPAQFRLFSREEVYQTQLLGFGTPHPRIDEFLGDFLAVGIGTLSLLNTYEDKPFIGVHAGLDAHEMVVPLILIETP